MNQIIDEMLKKYNATNILDKKNAIKEIMQEIVLCGLSRAGFFESNYPKSESRIIKNTSI